MGIGRLNIDTSVTFTGISDSFDVAAADLDVFEATEQSTSEGNAWRKYHTKNMDAMRQHAPWMFPENASSHGGEGYPSDKARRIAEFEAENDNGDNLYFENAEELLTSTEMLKDKFPGAGFMTRDDIMANINADIDAAEQEQSRVHHQATDGQKIAGSLMGTGWGALTDPVNVGAMVVAPAPSAWGIGAKMGWDAGLVMLTEAGIQHGAYNYKKSLGREATFQEAANIVLMSGAGAGLLRGAGHLLVSAYKRGIANGTVVDTPELRQAVEQIEETQQLSDDILPQTRHEIDNHLEVTDRAMENAAQGKPTTQADIDDARLEVEARQQIESLDPKAIVVDAEQFQFKSSGDKLGVTDRLKGVDEWDADLAGVVVVWERSDGQQFIVDGHQRLALANRALDAGQDPQQVLLNARVWKEVDGVTPSDARQRAAIKNIAEGTGTAIDAAKVLRELGDDGITKMPPLPPSSVLVRDAQGLSRLGDDAFKQIINDVIDARYGAIVGALVSDSAEQSAIIHALAIHKPSNLNQASIMVQDMRAAGFQRTETEDLFGGQTLTETLFKERARVIDHAMKQVRRDRQTFSVLNEQGGRIEAAGNVLNRNENLIRVTDGDAVMLALSKLANTKGAVSDAIQDAAERLKSGESIQKASSDLFTAIQREAIQKHRTRIAASEAGQSSETPSQIEIKEPPKDLLSGADPEPQGRVNINDEKQLVAKISSDLDDPFLKEMYEQDLLEASQLLATSGDDIRLPKRVTVNEAGEEIVETQTMREAFDDIEQEQDSLESLFICVGGS